MPAAVLVVHDEQNTRELAVSALREAFLEAVGFEDPIAALDVIEASSRVRVLVTRVMFGPGKLNGVALARSVRLKRPATRLRSCLLLASGIKRPRHERAETFRAMIARLNCPFTPRSARRRV